MSGNDNGSPDASIQSSPSTALPVDHNHLISLFQPVLHGLEEQVHRVASSQVELRSELDTLLISLREIKNKVESDTVVAVLEEKSKKLVGLKRRLTLIHTILQNANERCRKLTVNYKLPEQPS